MSLPRNDAEKSKDSSMNRISSDEDFVPSQTNEEQHKIDHLRGQLDSLQKQYKNQYKSQTIMLNSKHTQAVTEVHIKVIDNERRYVIKAIMQYPNLINCQPLFYICEYNFKQDAQKINAESECLTKTLLSYIESNGMSKYILSMQNILRCLENLLQELLDSFHHLTLTHIQIIQKTQCKFDINQIHHHPIPYPAIALSIWSPFGQLLTVHNAQTQKVLQEQRGELISLKDINNFIYATQKKRTIEILELNKNKQQTFIQDSQEQSDEFQLDFVHQGMKIIAEGDSTDCDYLNSQTSHVQTYFSHFQQQENFGQLKSKRDKKNNSSKDIQFQFSTINPHIDNLNQNYEYYDLNTDVVVGQQLKNLITKIEQDEKRISPNLNTHINIYDFSRYNYSAINQIQQFLDHLLNLKQKYENETSPSFFLFQVGLKDYFSMFKSQISQQFLDAQLSKKSFEEEESQLQYLSIIFKNILKIWLQKANKLNLLDSVIYFYALGWETLFNTLSLKDQLYALFLDLRELPQADRILKELKIAKSSIKDLEYSRLQQDLIQHIVPHFGANMATHRSTHRKVFFNGVSTFQMSKNESVSMSKNLLVKLKKFEQLEHPKYFLKTYQTLVIHKNLRFISPHTLMNKEQKAQAFPSQSVLKQFIQVSNPALCQRFLKEHQKYLDVHYFIIIINKAIHCINQCNQDSLIQMSSDVDYAIKKDPLFECSVCQIKISDGQYLTCSKCHHGGHFEHVIDWFRKNDRCPQCFECCCFYIN